MISTVNVVTLLSAAKVCVFLMHKNVQNKNAQNEMHRTFLPAARNRKQANKNEQINKNTNNNNKDFCWIWVFFMKT